RLVNKDRKSGRGRGAIRIGPVTVQARWWFSYTHPARRPSSSLERHAFFCASSTITRERRRARRRLHAASPEYSEGRDGKAVADGSAFDGQGHRGCGHVPDRRHDGYGKHPVRRWRLSFRPVVIEGRFVMN